MSVVHRKLIGSRCFLLSLLPKASISSVGSSLLSSFIESQPWQRMLSSTLQTFEQVTHAGIEQIMESPPYGLEVSASLCLPSIDGVECTISDTWHVLQENIDLVLNICTEDLYYDMLEREKEYVSPHTYSPNAGYLPYRRYLVDWMSDVGEQCRLHNSTIHVSVLFLDKIFRSTDIPRSQWQLLATACITVAAKYEEAEEHCPHIPELLRLTKLRDVGHNSLSFRDGELEVLHHLGWKLRAFPPIHIVGYILSKGACFVDDLWQGRALIPKDSQIHQKVCWILLQSNPARVLVPAVFTLPTGSSVSDGIPGSPSGRAAVAQWTYANHWLRRAWNPTYIPTHLVLLRRTIPWTWIAIYLAAQRSSRLLNLYFYFCVMQTLFWMACYVIFHEFLFSYIFLWFK